MLCPSKVNRVYGWRPGLPDYRYQKYASANTIKSAAVLPSLVDLRSQFPPVYDQGELGSCTANAGAALAQFLMIKGKKHSYIPSRLFLYYNERVINNTVMQDSGASLSDAIDVLSKLGAPRESIWWYNQAKFTVKPNKAVYSEASKHKVGHYLSLNGENIFEIKSCLAEGYPFICGITVYQSFESPAVAKTGVVPMPRTGEGMLGGHAICVVGYDDTIQSFIVRNSWGNSWGFEGHCYIPYAYIANRDFADDFWTAHSIT